MPQGEALVIASKVRSLGPHHSATRRSDSWTFTDMWVMVVVYDDGVAFDLT